MKRIQFKSTPNCATHAEYAEWVKLARTHPPGSAGFCEDCSQQYATEMRQQERCDHPEILFDKDGEGCIPTPYMIQKLQNEAKANCQP
jgi:hypothetical protein